MTDDGWVRLPTDLDCLAPEEEADWMKLFEILWLIAALSDEPGSDPIT